MALTPEQRQHLEQQGEGQIRLLLASSALPNAWMAPAAEWLAEIDAAHAQEANAETQTQRNLAISANNASWIATIVSIGALIVAVVGVLIATHH